MGDGKHLPSGDPSKKLPFSSSERELIVALVRERPIIEDKRTNAKNIELKKQAWEDLTVAYNSQPYVSQRHSQQLKRCWENIKTQRKKVLSQESTRLLTNDAAVTSNVISQIDKLFDSLNCDTPDLRRGKLHVKNMTARSPHVELFSEMKLKLR
ncbi:unnamed protein product [Diatraea saccharalis]|uniref:Myb/SANT-like DNA-binding domain-containing protein 3 n=1 Tax=Diatraea saccharalis TaxID=40085 RepID=A0A9N9RAJ7_9NEOP|nr:unnamed protein product [Diatraea saccharalis]